MKFIVDVCREEAQAPLFHYKVKAEGKNLSEALRNLAADLELLFGSKS